MGNDWVEFLNERQALAAGITCVVLVLRKKKVKQEQLEQLVSER